MWRRGSNHGREGAEDRDGDGTGLQVPVWSCVAAAEQGQASRMSAMQIPTVGHSKEMGMEEEPVENITVHIRKVRLKGVEPSKLSIIR